VEYRLLQNYPNPFVTSTTIKYQLPVAGDATIKIYNAHGQMVSTYRQQHNSSGHFSLLLDARNYAGGIYFYSLEVDGYYEVKKMMLLR
jgi:hypothetical protein